MISNPESTNSEYEVNNNLEINTSAAEQLEKISEEKKASPETSPRDIETQTHAQTEAEKKARERALEVVAKAENKELGLSNKSSSVRRGAISKKERKESYKKTMKQVQKELPTSSRAFSKIIHIAPIEKTSEIISSTIARPNAILSGSIVAFILTLFTYVTAKNIGYRLSGFETIIAFVIGWVIGILYDYLKAMITGKKL